MIAGCLSKLNLCGVVLDLVGSGSKICGVVGDGDSLVSARVRFSAGASFTSYADHVAKIQCVGCAVGYTAE